MINIGVRAHDFGSLPIDLLSGKAAGFGFTSIQLALNKALPGFEKNLGKLSPGLGNYIRDNLRQKGINVSVLGCYINPVHPDQQLREDALNRFSEHIHFCRDFGCSIVGTETGTTERFQSEETFQQFITSLKPLVSAAERAGVIVGIEGVADKDTIHSHERMLRVLELIPSSNLGVIYDPVNFLPNERLSESDALMEEAFELFSHRMVAVHAKDYQIIEGKKDGTLPSGKGLLNYPLLFDLIKNYKPWIHVLLENNTPETMTETVNFINKIKGEINGSN